jgi:murein DD-endopeptidase MepM/ murein hydrolase activator NlpD
MFVMHILGMLATVVLQSGISDGCAGVRIDAEPASPRQGTLFRVRVSGVTPDMTLSGVASGEPLHFSFDSSGARSMAAAPIDSASIAVVVECSSGAARNTRQLTVSLSPGAYRMEKLKVAPRFSTKPDSALEARQRREAERAAAVSRQAHETPRLWSPPFAAPRTSRITSRYGGGREFNGTITSRHMGTDYAGATGAPVRAVNRGVVRLVDNFYLGGKVVYVDHGAGLVTAYMHMSAQRVAVGDTVKRGTILGSVGATGRVTGPHLHLIVRYGSVSVDPESLLPKAR